MNTYIITDLINSRHTKKIIEASSYFEAFEIYVGKTQNEGCYYHINIQLLEPNELVVTKNEYWQFLGSLR